MKLLWIEDQYLENKEYDNIFCSHGTHVAYARTVAEALGQLAGEFFDCIVIDLRIPLGESPLVDHMDDLNNNAAYIVDFLEKEGLLPSVKVVCLTNFLNAARQLFEGKELVVVRKTGFLREFEEVIYGN